MSWYIITHAMAGLQLFCTFMIFHGKSTKKTQKHREPCDFLRFFRPSWWVRKPYHPRGKKQRKVFSLSKEATPHTLLIIIIIITTMSRWFHHHKASHQTQITNLPHPSSKVAQGGGVGVGVGTQKLAPKQCGHFHCHLSSSLCCSCSDKRPIRQRYYYNGVWSSFIPTNTGERWSSDMRDTLTERLPCLMQLEVSTIVHLAKNILFLFLFFSSSFSVVR